MAGDYFLGRPMLSPPPAYAALCAFAEAESRRKVRRDALLFTLSAMAMSLRDGAVDFRRPLFSADAQQR